MRMRRRKRRRRTHLGLTAGGGNRTHFFCLEGRRRHRLSTPASEPFLLVLTVAVAGPWSPNPLCIMCPGCPLSLSPRVRWFVARKHGEDSKPVFASTRTITAQTILCDDVCVGVFMFLGCLFPENSCESSCSAHGFSHGKSCLFLAILLTKRCVWNRLLCVKSKACNRELSRHATCCLCLLHCMWEDSLSG